MAEQEIMRIARAVLAEHGCLRAAIWHRTGVVEVGEASVGIAISSAHRAPRSPPASRPSTRSR